MGAETGIAWCDHTFNPWWGCTKISAECTNCYAEAFAGRYKFDIWGDDKPRRFFGAKHWLEPLKWNAAARDAGRQARVFCASMADVFERPKRPVLEGAMHAERQRLWALIERTEWLDWLLLTKRPENIPDMIPAEWYLRPRRNVWFGTTIGTADSMGRLDALRMVPAVCRFVSAEPVVDRDLSFGVGSNLRGINWLIIGGESLQRGKAREFDLDTCHRLIGEARAAGTAPFVKQLGAHPVWAGARIKLRDRAGADPSEWPPELRVREFPEVRHAL